MCWTVCSFAVSFSPHHKSSDPKRPHTIASCHTHSTCRCNIYSKLILLGNNKGGILSKLGREKKPEVSVPSVHTCMETMENRTGSCGLVAASSVHCISGLTFITNQNFLSLFIQDKLWQQTFCYMRQRWIAKELKLHWTRRGDRVGTWWTAGDSNLQWNTKHFSVSLFHRRSSLYHVLESSQQVTNVMHKVTYGNKHSNTIFEICYTATYIGHGTPAANLQGCCFWTLQWVSGLLNAGRTCARCLSPDPGCCYGYSVVQSDFAAGDTHTTSETKIREWVVW